MWGRLHAAPHVFQELKAGASATVKISIDSLSKGLTAGATANDLRIQ
jgi:hypothetical protein